jgi:hypothetical protein
MWRLECSPATLSNSVVSRSGSITAHNETALSKGAAIGVDACTLPHIATAAAVGDRWT